MRSSRSLGAGMLTHLLEASRLQLDAFSPRFKPQVRPTVAEVLKPGRRSSRPQEKAEQSQDSVNSMAIPLKECSSPPQGRIIAAIFLHSDEGRRRLTRS